MLITALKLKLFSVGAIVSNHIVNSADMNALFLQQLHDSLNDVRLLTILHDCSIRVYCWHSYTNYAQTAITRVNGINLQLPPAAIL